MVYFTKRKTFNSATSFVICLTSPSCINCGVTADIHAAYVLCEIRTLHPSGKTTKHTHRERERERERELTICWQLRCEKTLTATQWATLTGQDWICVCVCVCVFFCQCDIV